MRTLSVVRACLVVAALHFCSLSAQGATPAPPGRLLRFDNAGAQVAGTFITPVCMAFDEATSELFILELRGQIQKLKIN